MRWLESITGLKDMNLSELCKIVDRGPWHAVIHEVTKSQDTTQQLNNNVSTERSWGIVVKNII